MPLNKETKPNQSIEQRLHIKKIVQLNKSLKYTLHTYIQEEIIKTHTNTHKQPIKMIRINHYTSITHKKWTQTLYIHTNAECVKLRLLLWSPQIQKIPQVTLGIMTTYKETIFAAYTDQTNRTIQQH